MRVRLNSSGCSCWVQCPHCAISWTLEVRDQLRHARCEHRREHRVPGRGDHQARHVVDASARLIGGELPVAIEVAVPVHRAAEATGAEGVDVHGQLFGAEHLGAEQVVGDVRPRPRRGWRSSRRRAPGSRSARCRGAACGRAPRRRGRRGRLPARRVSGTTRCRSSPPSRCGTARRGGSASAACAVCSRPPRRRPDRLGGTASARRRTRPNRDRRTPLARSRGRRGCRPGRR